MAQKAARTGPGPTAMVALEQQIPEGKRIVDDDLAFKILPFGLRAAVWIELRLLSTDTIVDWSEKRMPGMWSGFMCRKRYIDDRVTEAVGDQASAAVILGAGFDTRAYRLPALSEVPVWEVDQPENIEKKRSRLKKIFGDVPTHVTLVPIDFDRQDISAVLDSSGYATDAPSFFIWEAVTQYLTEAGISATFDFLDEAPAGSRLAFTYVRKDFIEGQALYNQDYLYEKMILKDSTWLFGFDPDEVADFLDARGWRVLEHLGYDELAERYVRPTGRELLSTPLERIVLAERG